MIGQANRHNQSGGFRILNLRASFDLRSNFAPHCKRLNEPICSRSTLQIRLIYVSNFTRLLVRGPLRRAVVASPTMLSGLRAVVALSALAVVAVLGPDATSSQAALVDGAVAQRVIDATISDVFHFDLQSRYGYSSRGSDGAMQGPWFDGFEGKSSATALTVAHPMRTLLGYLRQEGVTVEEALGWMEAGAIHPCS